MRRISALLSVLFLLLFAAPGVCQGRPKLAYYYENYCGSCNIPESFSREFTALTGRSVVDYDCAFYNIARPSGRAAYEAAAEALGIMAEDRRLPMLVLDGAAYLGDDVIHESLAADMLDAGNGEASRVYLLTITPCDDCARARALIDALPDAVELNDGRLSPLEIIEVDLHRDTARATALFERYGVPEAGRMAPAAFLGETALCGFSRIEAGLEEALREGGGLNTPLFVRDAPGATRAAAFGLGSVIVAGLIGGLNPCALSMLLLFLSLLIPLRRKPARYALMYLAGKLGFYLLISIALSAVFRTVRLDWLPRVLKVALTVYCVALAAINLWDAVAAALGRHERLRNQLSPAVRGRLGDVMRRWTGRPGRLMLISAALGAVIASGEFLCAGQVYLAVFLEAFRADMAGLLPLLTAYCLAFLMPSAIAAAVVLRLKTAVRAGYALYRHTALIKLATALLLLAIAALAWLQGRF